MPREVNQEIPQARRVLKSSAVRDVALSADGRFVVKRYHTRGRVARWRRILGLSPAKREARMLKSLAASGLPVPAPIALERESDHETLLLEHCPGTDLQSLVLAQQLTPAERRALAAALGRLVARLHAQRVLHRDLHAGNVLVATSPDQALTLTLIDFHRARRLPFRLPDLLVRRELAAFARFFAARSSISERARFLRCYLETRAVPRAHQRHFARSLAAQVQRSLARFLSRRERRYVRPNRHTRRLVRGHWRGFAVTDREASLVAEQLDPFATEGHVLQATATSRVLDVTVLGTRCVVKQFVEPGLRGLAKRAWRGSRARRTWLNLQRLRMRDLPAPRPILFLQESWHRRQRRSLVVMEHVTGPQLNAHLTQVPCGDPGRALLLRELARAIRAMHDTFLRNRDLKAENILVCEGRPVFIDLDGLQRLARPRAVATIARDLARLNASFPTERHASIKERLRFLEWYAGGTTRSRRALRAAIVRATQAKLGDKMNTTLE